jgi:predicted RNase H-like HicB family nuclease
MPEPGDTLHVKAEYFTGFEEGDDVGHPYYVASCEEIVSVTDGRTWNELMRNIQEMIAASLEGEDAVRVYNLKPNPRVVITSLPPM